MIEARSFPQFKLRMPPALRFQVEQAAEASLRSLNYVRGNLLLPKGP